ncbi:MAG: replication initiation protein [Bacteroidales bacterium]|nr:replication initiation protein [Bacteroidales bacterium]
MRCALPHLLTTESYAFKELNKNVIQKAIDEINLKIENMDLEILTARRGRKVVQVNIHI